MGLSNFRPDLPRRFEVVEGYDGEHFDILFDGNHFPYFVDKGSVKVEDQGPIQMITLSIPVYGTAYVSDSYVAK